MNRTTTRLALAAVCALTMGACDRKPQFTVNGTIDGAEGMTLYLHHMALDGAHTVDSARLDAEGRFALHADAPDAPEFYVLRIDNQIVNLAIDSTETVTVTARYPGMASNYAVEGSDDCERIRLLALRQQDLQRRVVALEQTGGMTRQETLDSLERMIEAYKQGVKTDFIFQAPQLPSSYFALFQTLGQMPIFNPQASHADMRVFGAVATSWDTYYPESERTANLRNITLKSMNDSRIAEARSRQTIDGDKVVVSGVIDLRLPDAAGRLRSLTEMKGSVVLLDFHVFASEQSAARILQLRELYNKYHDRGFDIYQVSIDQDEHFWKQQTAALPWTSVFDPDGTSLAPYNVQAVPEFFIIDRNNQLQKRSSQMDDVEQEIKALL